MVDIRGRAAPSISGFAVYSCGESPAPYRRQYALGWPELYCDVWRHRRNLAAFLTLVAMAHPFRLVTLNGGTPRDPTIIRRCFICRTDDRLFGRRAWAILGPSRPRGIGFANQCRTAGGTRPPRPETRRCPAPAFGANRGRHAETAIVLHLDHMSQLFPDRDWILGTVLSSRRVKKLKRLRRRSVIHGQHSVVGRRPVDFWGDR
jgi:hypothetical protein